MIYWEKYNTPYMIQRYRYKEELQKAHFSKSAEKEFVHEHFSIELHEYFCRYIPNLVIRGFKI